MIPVRALRRGTFAGAVILTGALRLHAQSEVLSVEALRKVPVGGKVVAATFNSRGDSAFVLNSRGKITVVDLKSGGSREFASVRGDPRVIVRSRDDSRLAVGSGNDVHFFDAGGGDRTVRVGDDVTSLALSPTGATAAVGTSGGEVYMISAGVGEVLGRLRGQHDKEVVHVAFTGNGETLVSVGADRGIVYWDVKKLEKLRRVDENQPTILSAAATPAGDLLFVGTEERRRSGRGADPVRDMTYINGVRAYDVNTAAPQKSFDMNGRAPISLAVAPDCRYLGASVRNFRGTSLAVFDIERGTSVLDLPLDGRAGVVAFAPDGKTLVLGTDDGDVVIYGVKGVEPKPRCVADLRGTKFAITGPRAPLIKPSKRIRFAVLDLDDNGVGIGVARAIADQVTNRLALNPGIRLVERRRIAAIIQEQNFQTSGRTEAQGAIQLARILNVQKVIMGAVAKLGTTMTITLQMVDVETAAIDGSREVQCRACELEDLTQAVSELATTVVGDADPALLNLPDPPEIQIDYPAPNAEISGSSFVVRGVVKYSRPLDGVELVINGRPQDASRLLDRGGSKMTKLADGTISVPFVQEVPLEQASNLVAVRAIAADGNDNQSYVNVRRAPATQAPAAGRGAGPAAAAAPGISLDEITAALKSKVPGARIASLVGKYGVSFDAATNLPRLRDLGADAALLTALSNARRASAPPP